MDDSELDAIRQARLAELQKNAANASSSSSPSGGSSSGTSGGANSAMESMLSQILETSARERLSRVRIVRPDRAQQVEQYIFQLYRNGAITRKLGEPDIVQILDGLSRDSHQKQASKIIYNRKHSDDVDLGEEDIESKAGGDNDEDEDDFFD